MSLQNFNALQFTMALDDPLSKPATFFDTRRFMGYSAAGGCLYLNERDSDVAISVEWEGYRWHLPAHRLVLTAMSEVFRKMFELDMFEKNCGKVVITDSSPLTVKQFLKYLYMGALDFNGGREAIDLLKIAHKYDVQSLVALCESSLVTSITFSNACCLYETALTYSLQSLDTHTFAFILDSAFIITATDGFLNLKPKSLELFMESSLLNIENECSVLSTLRQWAIVSSSRKGLPLTKENVLTQMEPFFHHIIWGLIPEQLRTFVPIEMIDDESNRSRVRRKRCNFHVPASLQNHMNIMRFVIELGVFYTDKATDVCGLNCLRFGVDSHAYVAGFRMVGMFKKGSTPDLEQSSLSLGKDGTKCFTMYNLNSLPWVKGATIGDYVWRELTAYLPVPVRVNPFGTYVISIKLVHGRTSNIKWPHTRLDSRIIHSSLGVINFHSCSECYGITQLFVLPAPPMRNVCNEEMYPN